MNQNESGPSQKRGRGRPKGSKNFQKFIAEQETEPKEKRGRGRPKTEFEPIYDLDQGELTKKLRRPKFYSWEETRYREHKEDAVHQCDIMALGPYQPKQFYKFYYDKVEEPDFVNINNIFAVADVGTHKFDIYAMMGKDAASTTEAIEDIYTKRWDRKFLSKPKKLISDNGTEYQGEFAEYLKEINIQHVQKFKGATLGIVDNKIKEFKNILHLKMNKNKQKILKAMNEKKPNIPKPLDVEKVIMEVVEDMNDKVLDPDTFYLSGVNKKSEKQEHVKKMKMHLMKLKNRE